MRNDLTIYDRVSESWWSDDIRWVRTLKNLVPGPVTGLGPCGVNRRLDLTFGPLPLTAILHMGIARKPRVTP